MKPKRKVRPKAQSEVKLNPSKSKSQKAKKPKATKAKKPDLKTKKKLSLEKWKHHLQNENVDHLFHGANFWNLHRLGSGFDSILQQEKWLLFG